MPETPLSPFRERTDRRLGVAIELILLLMVVLSPWAFGSVEPLFELGLDTGLALILILWGARMLCQGEFRWKKSPVALCLAALILLAAFQMQNLPPWLLQTLSPNAAKLYAELLPAEPEVLPGGEVCTPPPFAAGKSISLYPGATRREMFRLLAVFLVFVAVRNNIDPARGLRRLFVVLVLNGTALAIFALVQQLTSSPDMIYWTYKTQGRGFGPFISGSHYPFYENICIGAGIGLLLAMFAHDRRDQKAEHDATWQAAGRRFIEDPRRLWLAAALAIMLCSVFVSLSRGGMLALIGAFVVLLLLLRKNREVTRNWLLGGVATAVVAVGLVAWVGGKAVAARTETIIKGQALAQSRLAIWADGWPLVGEFWLTGTGFGTYAYAEPLHRKRVPAEYFVEHAHNEYLEAAVEGGVVRLVISLLAIGFVFRAGYQAVSSYRGRSVGGLAVGVMFGFTAFVIHSIGDFGVHLPAVALLVAVLVGEVVGLGEEATDKEAGVYAIRWAGAAPVAFGGLLVFLAALLFWDGFQFQSAQAFRLLATSMQNKKEAIDRDRTIACLVEAVRRRPDAAWIITDLGEACLARLEEEQNQINSAGRTFVAAQIIAGGISDMPLPALVQCWGAPVFSLFPAILWETHSAQQKQQNRRKYMLPALRAFVLARDICPLRALPQVRIGAYAPFFAKADPRNSYVSRAKQLRGNDPDIWFFVGLQEMIDGQKERAAQTWRGCLNLSDKYTAAILEIGKTNLDPKLLANEVLVDHPRALVRLSLMYTEPNGREAKRLMLETALATLSDRPASTANIHLQAQAHEGLEQAHAAIAEYRKILAQEPLAFEWRFELASLLRAQGRLTEAKQELMTILSQQPTNVPARQLLDLVNNEHAHKLPPS